MSTMWPLFFNKSKKTDNFFGTLEKITNFAVAKQITGY